MISEGQPKTFDERIQRYRTYQEKYNVTLPVLIDSMNNKFRKTYKPGPTSCVIIDIRGIVVHTIQFVMSPSSYGEVEKKVGEILQDAKNYLASPLSLKVRKNIQQRPFTFVKKELSFSLSKGTFSLYTLSGKMIFKSVPLRKTNLNLIPPGIYFLKINHNNQQMNYSFPIP